MAMLIRYSAIIGAANTVWFQGSADGVSTAATMKLTRTAYLTCRHSSPAVTRRRRARNSTSVGIWKTTTMPIVMFL